MALKRWMDSVIASGHEARSIKEGYLPAHAAAPLRIEPLRSNYSSASSSSGKGSGKTSEAESATTFWR
jgi:hypothetical protein